MQEIIKKILEEFDDEFYSGGEWNIDTTLRKHLVQFIINSHITLAEEKIKELEGEMKIAGLYITGKNGGDYINYRREDDDVKRESYNQAKQEEIDKWKEVKDLLVKE